MIKPLLGLASPAGARGRLSTLIFHRVHATSDALFPEELDAGRFEAVCRWVKAWFNVLPLDEAAQRLAEGDLPARALALTFDDGYADNHEVAAPILQRLGLPCTFFVATGYLDGGQMWNDTVIESVRACRLPALDLRGLHPLLGVFLLKDDLDRRQAIDAIIQVAKYLPPESRQALVDLLAARAEAVFTGHLMMTSKQVQDLRRMGMLVGAHTVTHPILCGLSRPEARKEIEFSKLALESLLTEDVRLFAYPNGKPGEDFSAREVSLVRDAGFLAAASTQWGCSDRATSLFQLRRFTPWDRSRLAFGMRLLRNLRAS